MKVPLLSLALIALILTLPGCGKSDSPAVSADPSSQIESSFTKADEEVKAKATRAVNALKTADHEAAMAELVKLAADPKLTDQQKEVVAQALDQLKNAAEGAGKPGATDASKAIDDAQKTLSK